MNSVEQINQIAKIFGGKDKGEKLFGNKLINMKRPKPKLEKAKAEAVVSESEQYPYGLRITLQNEELSKLGIQISKFDVDQEVNIVSKGKVVGLRQDASSDRSGEKKSTSMEIQITKLIIKE